MPNPPPEPTPRPWSVIARNLPEHAVNAIHTDAGARAAGFPAALVAGVTTYVSLCHPVLAAWGEPWLAHGGGEVRFRSPVFAGDELRLVPTADPGGDAVVVEAHVAREPGRALAVFRAVPHAGPPLAERAGEDLPTLEVRLDGDFGADYGVRAGDPLPLCPERGLVHPAVWPALGNRTTSAHLVRGAWIHLRSVVRHHEAVPAGVTVAVHARVVDRFERSGERAVVDVRVVLEGRTVVTLEHESIIALPGA